MSNVKGRTFLRYQMRRAAYSKLLTPITAVYQGKRRDDKAGGHISNTAFWDQKLSGEWSSYIERSGSRLTLARMIASLTSSALPDATSAIDIGCGSGVLATALLERGFDRYVGVDISDVAVQSATEYMNANRELFPATFLLLSIYYGCDCAQKKSAPPVSIHFLSLPKRPHYQIYTGM